MKITWSWIGIRQSDSLLEEEEEEHFNEQSSQGVHYLPNTFKTAKRDGVLFRTEQEVGVVAFVHSTQKSG